jgi:MGT family glycosyltransferase
MAKIAYIGIPAHGHTNPTLPVVQELIQQGHEVLYYNAEPFRAKVSPTGVDFRAYPEPMPTEREISEALYEFINASLMFSRMSRHLTTWVIDEMRREQPDVILYDTTAMWGYIAGRTLGIPHICLITHFVLDGSVGMLGIGNIARYIASALPHLGTLMRWKRDMANQYGKNIAGGITEYSDRNIVFTSKEFHPPNKFTDERFRFVGASLNPATRTSEGGGDFPFDLLDGRKTVYISLGTINNLDNAFYDAAFKAFADYPAQFVLSVGKNTDIASLGDIPANFIVRNYVPQLEVLQHASAFITHGGMNSIHEGLVYGVPLVVVPHHFEQLLNGKRVAQTGTGVLIGDKAPYGRVTVDELRRALDTVLDDPAYAQQAAYYGKTLIDAGGYMQAVAEIEAHIGATEPVKVHA